MRSMCTGCLLLLVAGCTTTSTQPNFMSSAEYQSREAATESLFASDREVMNGDDINKILGAKATIPKNARLAVLRFGSRRPWLWWSGELAQRDHDLEKGLIEKLRNSRRAADASLLPSLMTPRKRTIPHLRVAAARYQADLLLIYRSASHTYEKQRIFSADQVKAKCVVEAILLDVRTGLVPFASVARQEYQAKESKKDFGFEETMAMAEMEAVSKALTEIGADLATFLDAVP